MRLIVLSDDSINFHAYGVVTTSFVTDSDEPIEVQFWNSDRKPYIPNITDLTLTIVANKGDTVALAACNSFTNPATENDFFTSTLVTRSSEILAYRDNKNAWLELRWNNLSGEQPTLPARVKIVQTSGDASGVVPVDADAAARALFFSSYFFSGDSSITFTVDSLAGTMDLRAVSGGGGTTAPVGTIWDGLYAAVPSGWLRCNGQTIGSAASGAANAGVTFQALYLILWAVTPNTTCAVSGGRGGSAAADWSANKTLAIPNLEGKVRVGSGEGSLAGVTLNSGVLGGAQTVIADSPYTVGDHTHSTTLNPVSVAAGIDFTVLSETSSVSPPVSISTTSAGGGSSSGSATSVVQPFISTMVIIKT